MEKNILGASRPALGVAVYLVLAAAGCAAALFFFLSKYDQCAAPPGSTMLALSLRNDSARTLRVQLRSDSCCADSLHLIAYASDSAGRVLSDTVRAVAPCGEPSVPDSVLLGLVLLAAALGACLHGLTSLVEFVGNDKFVPSWTLWYLLRPVAGGLLALVFYLVARGGVFNDVGIRTSGELYGVLAVAGLIGLFSKQGLYKLSDLFDVLFQSKKEDRLKDKLNNAPPEIAGTDPAALKTGGSGSVTVKGKNFTRTSVVRVNKEPRMTTYTSATQISFVLAEADTAAAGTLELTVANPGKEEKISAPYLLKVE